jgi:putative cell wall-binding protein
VADHADPTHSQGHTLRDRFTAAVAALFVATLVLGATPRTAHAAGLKVAIIVGPTGALTDQYRGYADEEAAAAAAAGATVVKVYSPKATWAKVKAAVAGANLVIYHGHGSGFPNPYGSTEMTDRANGWGLNKTETGGDAETGMVYCGEKALLGTLKSTDGAAQWSYCGGSTDSDGIAPAPNFVMVYANACYTAGSSEPGKPVGDLATARARVANFSYPVLKLGANGYFATDLGAESLVQRLLTQRDTNFADLYRADAGYDASAQRRSVHPEVDGDQVWVQKTYSRWLGTDYWYAFAGNPNATPDNGNIAPPPPPPSASVSRISGTDRYATAAAVSASQFDPGVGVAYVATGTNFPDALAGGAAAAHAHGPMLLVTQDTVPSATATELQRLQPKEIVVLGGNGTVSDGVLGALRSYTNGTVRRIAGASRYETAALISQDAFASPVPVAYVATGATFPDALAGVPASGAAGGPVLLVSPTGIPAATATELARLKPAKIVILGASGVVSSATASALAAYAPVSRLAGSDRYATAVAISKASFPSASVVFVATGTSFPDALGGGPVAGISDGPLLLVPGTSLPSAVAGELQRLWPQRVVVLGGTGVVSSGVADQIANLLGG